MAASAVVKLDLEITGLGSTDVTIRKRYSDSNVPTEYFKGHTIISTTEALLSAIIDLPTTYVRGLFLTSESGGNYVNCVSTAISTTGMYVPSGQSIYCSFTSTITTKIGLKGDDAASAIGYIVWTDL